MQFIDLGRSFRELTAEEQESPEFLVALADSRYDKSIRWPEILLHPRVVLLAEAGSGKTCEMREQARQMQAEGKAAFFLDLATLGQSSVLDLLKPDEERRLKKWQTDNSEAAWFFLDAADELKLTSGKLDLALARLAKVTDGLLHRTRVVVSCRPTDWRPSSDRATLLERLPIVPDATGEQEAPKDAFLAPLITAARSNKSKELRVEKDRLRVFALLPLGEKQIATLAKALGVNDVPVFVTEITRRDVLTFAARPLDLIELIDAWRTSGRLGTLLQQHESSVRSKLKDEPNRKDGGVLSEERARLGAERLALALTLARATTIRVPDQDLAADRATEALDSSAILTDWSEAERQALLRRALFDPATYGRIRFHHRSVQEYLAARRLQALQQKGMPWAKIARLLFAEIDGLRVVIPSMRSISAWLALWNKDVRREVISREPETLLSMGDPGSLQLDVKRQLLQAFSVAYGAGGWRGLDIPIREIRRLACPELSELVRELWGAGPVNDEVRSLLLDLMWQGALEDCSDIAEQAAGDGSFAVADRVVAIRALRATGCSAALMRIATSITCDTSAWPAGLVHGVAGELFPAFLTATDLVGLVHKTREPENGGSGFSWALRQIVTCIEPAGAIAVELRNRLANLIWDGRKQSSDWHERASAFGHAVPGLALLCERQLAVGSAIVDPALVRASAVAVAFAKEEVGGHELIASLRQRFLLGADLRREAFWAQLSIVDELASELGVSGRIYRTQHDGLVSELDGKDLAWLVAALRSGGELSQRKVALLCCVRLWSQRGRVEDELVRISLTT